VIVFITQSKHMIKNNRIKIVKADFVKNRESDELS